MQIMDLLAQPFVDEHFRPGVNIVHAVQLAQRDCVAQKVIALKSRANAKDAVASLSALDIVQENGNHRYFSAQEPG